MFVTPPGGYGEARNRLAHMRPLSLGDQESLLAACHILF